MGEVSKLTGLEPHVLRNWEKTYSQLSPKKNNAGNRVFKEREVELIFKIKSLLMEKKYSPDGVKKVLNGDQEVQSPGLSAAAKKDLREIRVFLNDLLEKL